jgi:hypothetical protein
MHEMKATDRGQFLCIADNNVRPPADYTAEFCCARQRGAYMTSICTV